MAEANKTEKATPKKRRDERKKGNAFQSKEVTSIVTLIIGFIFISKLGHFIMIQVKENYISQLSKMGTMYELTITGSLQLFREAAIAFFISTLPILIALAIAGILMSGVQTGFIISAESIKFKFHKINMLEGLKRIMSLRSIVELVKSILKVSIIMWIIYTSTQDLLSITPDMLHATLEDNITFMMERVMAIVYKICIIFVAIAVLDVAYQKYDYEHKLMMTKQEIKDEWKQTEGDPQIKGKIRERQRRISMNRMIQQVPQADVIVRNPTHFAVALRYDINKDQAPIVVAQGQDYMAKRIIDAGMKHNILITENKPLARSLFESVEVNSYIPAQLYQAVAELMAWVYSNKEKGKKGIR